MSNPRLALARYYFTLRVSQPVALPGYAGSALRGVFGHSLRRLCCITGKPTCDNCPVATNCPYATVFEPLPDTRLANTVFSTLKKIPVPYCIEPPLRELTSCSAGETFRFSMVLVAEALNHLPLILLAWRDAFHKGIGPDKGKADLILVEWENPQGQAVTIWSDTEPTLKSHQPGVILPVLDGTCDFHLRFVTPLRIERKGRALAAQYITEPELLRSLIRRISMMSQCHGGLFLPVALEQAQQLNALADQVEGSHTLKWQDMWRYSSRQKRNTPLGGLVGEWQLRAVPILLQPYIQLGQWLHVGKEAAFGLGAYQILKKV